jgi:hypothetical protein
MRRSFAFALLVTLFACLTPVPAHAYFWDWVDSLSGPQYHGATIEWKVYCRTSQPTKVVESLKLDFQGDLDLYRQMMTDNPGWKDDLQLAVDALDSGVDDLDNAIAALPSRKAPSASVLVANALESRFYAARVVAWLHKGKKGDKPEQTTKAADTERVKPMGMIGSNVFVDLGISASLCEAGPLERHTQYLALNIGWGSDTKRDPQFEAFATDNNPATDPNPDKNTLVTFSASYHAVANPWLTVGLGGGLASFSSRTRPAFRKWYVEPYIIDVRPVRAVTEAIGFAGRWKRAGFWNFKAALQPKKLPSRNPLPDLLYLRYNAFIFPTGFEAERFRGSEQFQAEFVRAYGVHVDLEPLIRKMRGNY